MISAVVLTHNDESSIQRTLKSISWCDEMIVIDDASADSTEEIAKKAGAKVFKRTLEEDFAAQRNFGLSKAKGEWVLFVDSDEVVPNELQKEIKKAVTSSYNGFYIKRRDFWGGKCLGHGEQGRMTLLRLAKKVRGIGRGRFMKYGKWQGLSDNLIVPFIITLTPTSHNL